MLKAVLAPSAALAMMLLPMTAHADEHVGEPATERQKVLGFGGFFFRSDDPAALADWYLTHLGIDRVPTSYEIEPWVQEGGHTVFAPFPRATEAMGAAGKEFVLNFRVADLDAMVGQLRADGIAVEVDPQTYPNGRFASLTDPEGNPIQLWEPASLDRAANQLDE